MPKKVNKIPFGVIINQDIRERAKEYFVIQLLGKEYYVPITKEAQKLFKLQDGRVDNDSLIEHWLRDIIHGIYLQIRDTVGSEIESTLVSEMKDGFEKMFGRVIEQTVQSKIRAQLPEIKKEKKVKVWPEQPEWLKRFVSGYSNSNKWHPYLEGPKWCVAFQEGYTSYLNRASGNGYSPAEYILVKTDNQGYWHHPRITVWEGRLTQEGKDFIYKIFKQANETDITDEQLKQATNRNKD